VAGRKLLRMFLSLTWNVYVTGFFSVFRILRKKLRYLIGREKWGIEFLELELNFNSIYKFRGKKMCLGVEFLD